MRLMLFMDCELGLFLGFFLVLWNLCFGELFGVNHLLYLMRIVGILCFNYINFVFFFTNFIRNSFSFFSGYGSASQILSVLKCHTFLVYCFCIKLDVSV